MDGYEASAAVDANPGTCSSTQQEGAPWWMVDLGKLYDVEQVNIVNTAPSGCQNGTL